MKLEMIELQDLADVSRMLGGADSVALDSVKKIVGTYMEDAVEDVENLIKTSKMEYITTLAKE